MISQKYTLQFPQQLVYGPVVSRLVSTFGLKINILNAHVESDKSGKLDIEIKGSADAIQLGTSYLKDKGIQVGALARIHWREECCIECTACRSTCPSGALIVQFPELSLMFNSEKCIACKLCLSVCPYNALTLALN